MISDPNRVEPCAVDEPDETAKLVNLRQPGSLWIVPLPVNGRDAELEPGIERQVRIGSHHSRIREACARRSPKVRRVSVSSDTFLDPTPTRASNGSWPIRWFCYAVWLKANAKAPVPSLRSIIVPDTPAHFRSLRPEIA